jgi:pimeloyl-ACP methyl ester carboxylesterase/DNA-binding winged helix-turn-helix (wHTH) protein
MPRPPRLSVERLVPSLGAHSSTISDESWSLGSPISRLERTTYRLHSVGSGGCRHRVRSDLVALEVRVLGPLQCVVDGRDITPSAPKELSLLATLIAHHARPVSVDTLTDELWPALTPVDARRVLRVRVAGLRKLLRGSGLGDVLESVGSGYRLSIGAEALDANLFWDLVDRARRESAACDPTRASSSLREALGMWRGEPYEGIRTCASLDAEIARLSDAYVGVIEDRIDADLACGHHRRLISELDALVVSYPLRERLWGQRVLALYRCDRQAEALRACAQLRENLRHELGLRPGATLRALESAVLEQRDDLDWCSVTGPLHHSEVNDTRARAADSPPVRYARSASGVNVAYQVSGDGSDLLVVPGFTSHLEVWWAPWSSYVAERLSRSCRLILFDKRGTGLSDRPPNVGVEDWLDDIELVLDAVGSRQSVVVGVSAGGAVATLFAARHPERVRALVLFGASPKYIRSDDYPHGISPDRLDPILEQVEAGWGDGFLFERFCPSAAGDARLRSEYARFQRLSASPGAAVSDLRTLLQMDVRDALPLITAPTLVIHARGDRSDPIERARYMADRISGARLIELDSDDHLIWLSDRREQLVDEIEAFVRATDSKSGPDLPRGARSEHVASS